METGTDSDQSGESPTSKASRSPAFEEGGDKHRDPLDLTKTEEEGTGKLRVGNLLVFEALWNKNSSLDTVVILGCELQRVKRFPSQLRAWVDEVGCCV